jgi:virginiamycin B lyase
MKRIETIFVWRIRYKQRRKQTMTLPLSNGHSERPHSYYARRHFPTTQSGFKNILRLFFVAMLLVLVGTAFFHIQSARAASSITEFHVASVGVSQGITAGPDGKIWFTLFYGNVAGRITPQGTSTLFNLNTLNSATFITNGPDGALWLTLLNDVGGSTTNQIGRLTTSGALKTFTVPLASYIWDITNGPGGKLYFTDGASRVWSVTTSGHFTAFPFTDSSGGYPYQITKGPDGNLWFTDRAHQIVRMTPQGKFTAFTIPTSNATTDAITVGPDGNLWFTLDDADSSRIGRITTAGAITLFTLPAPSTNDYLFLQGITTGADGNLWFTYKDWTSGVAAIGRMTTSGTITLTATPTTSSLPTDITAGADGNLWFTEGNGDIGRITTG